MPKVVIIGAGLVGSLNACFFAKRGWQVDVYEARPDIRQIEHVPGRSINLALSIRGKSALDCVGLREYIEKQGVRMYARLVHDADGKTLRRQPYGKPGEHIVSINRRQLNEVMISQAEQCPAVTFHFRHKLDYLNRDSGELVFTDLNNNNELRVPPADLVCACDGAYSAVRRALLKVPRFNYSQEYISHGYLELNILPTADNTFAMEPNVFHLWPRGQFTLIALANQDKTFTVTLFAPFTVFDSQLCSDEGVERFFRQHFIDALNLIGPDVVKKMFREVRPGAMVSVKCAPHHYGSNLLLMGDAAHAMVPFYGQGMNCGFEDCLVLSEMLDQTENRVSEALVAYSQQRCVDAHAINDLAMYNYTEKNLCKTLQLRDLVNSRWYVLRKRTDALLHSMLGRRWMPLYSMVTFSRTRYTQAVEHRRTQDLIYSRVLSLGILVGLAGVTVAAAKNAIYIQEKISTLFDRF